MVTATNTDTDSLVEANLSLVSWVVSRTRYSPLTPDEAMQAGRIGLWRAAKRFDDSKGFKFSTYAVYAIKSNILDERRKVIGRSDRATNLVMENEVSFSDVIGFNPNDEPVLELEFVSPFDLDTHVESSATLSRIADIIATLCYRDQVIAKATLVGYKRHEIAKALGLSESRVCQLWIKIKAKLLAVVMVENM